MALLQHSRSWPCHRRRITFRTLYHVTPSTPAFDHFAGQHQDDGEAISTRQTPGASVTSIVRNSSLAARSSSSGAVTRLARRRPLSFDHPTVSTSISDCLWRNGTRPPAVFLYCRRVFAETITRGGSASGPYVEEKERTYPIPDSSSLLPHRLELRLAQPTPPHEPLSAK
ncbi:hypothetical protein AWENTII_004786 [Aspergillus wentii]